ncbi:crossover junction endodeoxyribonuclease RuvC, partial [bacterium]
IIAAALTGLDVSEVSPAEAKLALTGNGNATKEQVAYMIKQLLSPPHELSTDASDAAALGVAFFHRMALEEVE